MVSSRAGKSRGSRCQVELCIFETAVGDGGSNLQDPMSQAFFAQGVYCFEHILPRLSMRPTKLIAPRSLRRPLMQSPIVGIVLDVLVW
ncbi:hypothetical protein ASC97_29420 [Rhizobium sp. Root1203]|nr:hypothetical protein ASC97_29420 [Rhizobium sp. Root1203]